ncbi:unnamed protein product [Closterium sp. NIES-54]
MHLMRLMINLFRTHLTEIETRIHAIASTTGGIAPPIFEGCALPHFPTLAESTTFGEATAAAEVASVSAPFGGQGRRRGTRDCRGGGHAGMSGGARTSESTCSISGGSGSASADAGAMSWQQQNSHQKQQLLHRLHQWVSQRQRGPAGPRNGSCGGGSDS